MAAILRLVPGAEAAPPSPVPPLATLHHAQQAPSSPFAPRDAYIKLLFRDNPSVAIKLRWLSEVNGAFHLDRDQAEVKMAAITSRFVYISRHRPDIVTSIQDSPDKPRKFPTYLLTRYPVCSDPALAKELPGVYSARRFYQKGSAINRLVVTWSLPQPPPPSVAFSFLPSLPSCEFRRMKDEQPWCFRCWGFGHISRYCFRGGAVCAWCSGPHDSRSCPHRAPPPAAPASDSASTPPQVSPPDTSLWECPRCHQAGVNVWHGCADARLSPLLLQRQFLNSHLHHHLSAVPLTLPYLPLWSLRSPGLLRLKRLLMEARLAWIVWLNSRATLNAFPATVAESQKVIIASVATFAEKMDVFAARFESPCLLPLPPGRLPVWCPRHTLCPHLTPCPRRRRLIAWSSYSSGQSSVTSYVVQKTIPYFTLASSLTTLQLSLLFAMQSSLRQFSGPNPLLMSSP
ncbi:hypothetical protein GWK47_038423 [Chionoecetes opilio]|uniref:Uncharacterized protein n=1 Tax=Chionoecetes opilio TaxID=41210 RepID=A0A8J4YL63_CHIOP|nr:hypothetical protein GWK47_038423 [Chionoecetes opilio]